MEEGMDIHMMIIKIIIMVVVMRNKGVQGGPCGQR
jgi:hypothetical protein